MVMRPDRPQPRPRPALAPVEQRRSQLGETEAVAGAVFTYCLTFNIVGAGQTEVNVNFPVRFAEIPAVSSGLSLEAGSTIEAGNMPYGFASVLEWTMAGVYYAGARLGLIAFGASDQLALIHFQVEGKALQPPFPS